jgi:hypothetical protein
LCRGGRGGRAIPTLWGRAGAPHFHARYESEKATFVIRDLRVIEGSLPPRVRGLVTEWAAVHGDELLANWARAARRLPLVPIAPLE